MRFRLIRSLLPGVPQLIGGQQMQHDNALTPA